MSLQSLGTAFSSTANLFLLLLRYPATSETTCGNACGAVAGCTGFIFYKGSDTEDENDTEDESEYEPETCYLVLGSLVTKDPDDETEQKNIVDVGKLSEFCGQKFSKDIVQVSSYEIALPGSAAAMKEIIASIMQSEKERGSEQQAGVWRLRTNDAEGIFYSQGSANYEDLAAFVMK